MLSFHVVLRLDYNLQQLLLLSCLVRLLLISTYSTELFCLSCMDILYLQIVEGFLWNFCQIYPSALGSGPERYGKK